MSAFSLLPDFLQTLIPLLLFLEAVLELGLFIYQFTHLPCEEMIELLSSFGLYTKDSLNTKTVERPMKDKMKILRLLNTKNKIKDMYRNMSNITTIKKF